MNIQQFFQSLRCLSGSHNWRCNTPTNDDGWYVEKPQTWVCANEFCQKRGKTYLAKIPTNKELKKIIK